MEEMFIELQRTSSLGTSIPLCRKSLEGGEKQNKLIKEEP
jgi:hypothetical protein